MSATHKSHGRACARCGLTTYSETGQCPACQRGMPIRMPDPARLGEDYLMRCAEELLKRHKARTEALRKLGLLEAA